MFKRINSKENKENRWPCINCPLCQGHFELV